MSSHLHMIAKPIGSHTLPEILRDFKKYTAKAIIQQIMEGTESRKEWMLARFRDKGKYLKRIENYKFWQDGYHAETIFSNHFFYEKLNYIHQNPVKELTVLHPEDYYFSSPTGMDFLITVVLETSELITY